MNDDIPHSEGPDSNSFPVYSTGFCEEPSPQLDLTPYADELGRDRMDEDLSSKRLSVCLKGEEPF